MSEKEKTNPAQWVAAHADYLYAFALKRLPDRELCQDLVQETFMSAIKNISQYQGISSARTWMTAILKNKIIDFYRKRNTAHRLINHPSGEENTSTFFEEKGHWKGKHSPRTWGMEESSPLENEELKQIMK